MSGGGKNNGPPESQEARDLYRLQGTISREMWDDWKQYGEPVLANLSEEASEGLSPALRQERIAAAGADVTQAFAGERDALESELAGYGINPASGRYASAHRRLGLGEAAARAGAKTRVRRGLDDEEYNRKLDVVGIASGQGNAGVRGLGSAAGGIGQIGAQIERSRNSDREGLGSLTGTAITAGAVLF